MFQSIKIFISGISFIKKRGQCRLRKDLAGDLNLKQTNRQGRIKEVKRVIDNTACITKGNFSRQIFGATAGDAEIVVRQFLLRSVIENRINRVLINGLGNNRAIIYPLPKQWRNVLRKEGITVAGTRSGFAFFFFVIARFLYNISLVINHVAKAIAATMVQKKKPLGRYVFFDALTKMNIPHQVHSMQEYNIVSWYWQWKGRPQKLDNIVQTSGTNSVITDGNIPVISMPFFIQPLFGLDKLIKFSWWGCEAIFICVLDLLRGRWWHALMLGEAAQSALVRIHDKEELAIEYLFHNSSWIYRPLWTYDAEKAGAAITFYFYSTNIEPLQYGHSCPDAHVGWRTATWPHYLVWDQYQADFVERSIERKTNITVAGPVWFHSGAVELPVLPGKSVAVFDVQPMRESFYYTLGIDFDYYIPYNCNSFLDDIYTSLCEYNVSLVFKQKRKIGKMAHYHYRNLLNRLAHHTNFISVDADTPAQIVIENCIAVISMPFTSTALIGKQLGKPSVYYDPHGQLQKTDRAAHGIDIITGRAELVQWLDKVLNN